MKNTTKTLLATIMSGYLLAAGGVIAGSDVEPTVVEIRADKEKLTTIRVESNGIEELIELTPEELADDAALETRLAILDKKTRKTVMQALQGTRHMVDGSMDLAKLVEMKKHGAHKVMVINGGEGHVAHEDLEVLVDFDSDDHQSHKLVRKHVIVDGTTTLTQGEHTVIKGHSDAIVRLIEKGEFSQEELDSIQAALDAKR